MENNFRCWQCKFVFVGHDTLASSTDHQCPRCGVWSRALALTPEDKKIGKRYLDVGTGLVVRAGRERQDLFAHGYYKLRTHGTEILDVQAYGDYVPSV